MVVKGMNTAQFCIALSILSLIALIALPGFGSEGSDFCFHQKGKTEKSCIQTRKIHTRPDLFLSDDFMSAGECQFFIETYRPLLSRSTVLGSNPNESVTSTARTSYTAYLPTGQGGSILRAVEMRACKLLDIDRSRLESIQMVRYEPGQLFRPHHDYFPDMKKSTQRSHTALVYLNDLQPNDTGGQTRFPEIGVKVTPKRGRVISWTNCTVNSESLVICDKNTLHGGDPTQKSIKFVLNFWFHFI